MTPSRDVLIARAFLASVAEPPAPALARFVLERGPAEAASRVRDGRLPPAVLDEVDARRAETCGDRLLTSAEEVGIRLAVPEEPDWPVDAFGALRGAAEMGIPGMAEPLALWVRPASDRARRAELDSLMHTVAVVGARAASGYGEHVATDFGYRLASEGYTVVSGAAYGIDGAAHRGALAGGRTVAVLACGVDLDYPAGHGRLLGAIAEQGMVISEFPPGTPPRKHRFLVRNRLIAALGSATVVVEAGARSGAANTAHTADALGRPVLAVPGPVTAPGSVGCHQLVRSGTAMLVTRTEEIIELLSPLGTVATEEASGPRRITDELDPAARRIHDVLRDHRQASAEDIARDTGLPLRKVRALLPMLEMSGLLVRKEDGWARGSR